MVHIHPKAIVHEHAVLGEGTVVGPYAVIGPEVHIGAHNQVQAHVVLDGKTTIGDRNTFFPFAAIGGAPQDVSYRGEPTEVVIGDDNVFREGVTVHRGTVRGVGVTRIGSHNYFMNYAHVAHDCIIGDHVIMANFAALAGHVVIGDHAVIGGLVGVHQFVRIGQYAFIGGMTAVVMDIPPFMLASGIKATLYGPNLVGLKRANIAPEAISALKQAYRIIFRSKLTLSNAIEEVRQRGIHCKEVEDLLTFLRTPSKRGITR